MGLHKAFPDAKITGVDIAPQPRYPFKFLRADALALGDILLADFDFIWASPPCQQFCALSTREDRRTFQT